MLATISMALHQTLAAGNWCHFNDGVLDSQSGSSAGNYVTSGGTYGTLPTVTRSGYAFNGWYTASSEVPKLPWYNS